MPNAPFSTHVWKSHLTLTAACLCDCEIPILLRRNNKIGVLVDLLYGNSQNVVCDSKDLGLFNNCCVGECPRANFCYLWNKLLFSSRPFFFFRRTGPMARGLTRLCKVRSSSRKGYMTLPIAVSFACYMS